jgi:hypothetical protein
MVVIDADRASRLRVIQEERQRAKMVGDANARALLDEIDYLNRHLEDATRNLATLQIRRRRATNGNEAVHSHPAPRV